MEEPTLAALAEAAGPAQSCLEGWWLPLQLVGEGGAPMAWLVGPTLAAPLEVALAARPMRQPLGALGVGAPPSALGALPAH